ncbi:hypothetical protein IFR05_001252 [Cadophora sp. M221]|nr:hypothetical protein IFR05_001252 [Cadophora sp. M221]
MDSPLKMPDKSSNGSRHLNSETFPLDRSTTSLPKKQGALKQATYAVQYTREDSPLTQVGTNNGTYSYWGTSMGLPSQPDSPVQDSQPLLHEPLEQHGPSRTSVAAGDVSPLPTGDCGIEIIVQNSALGEGLLASVWHLLPGVSNSCNSQVPNPQIQIPSYYLRTFHVGRINNQRIEPEYCQRHEVSVQPVRQCHTFD